MTSSQPPKARPTPAAVHAPAPDAEALRRVIVERLMRHHCQSRGGCTRSCRRQKRCVAADAFARGEAE